MLGHQLLHQLQNLLLHRDVERRGGLVSNQEIRPAGQRHGNGDALALTARELVRIVVKALGGPGDTYALQQFQRPAAGGLFAQT